ncbi:MAG: S1/P1 nuclease [Alistipes sp.]|nr:S1/P1 nuclease [Candidatus Alistipes equi]
MRKGLVLLATLMLSLSCAAWGRFGHTTIAEIAERHLKPDVKERIMHYTKGQHLADFALFMDSVVNIPPYKQALKGWHATIVDVKCRCTKSIRESVRKSRDGVTAMEDFRKSLKNYKELDDSTVFLAIKCIVHIVADFHCPSHIRYEDKGNDGKEPIKYFKKKTTIHKVWDTALIQGEHKKWTYKMYADKLDTFSEKEIKRVTKGWAKEWFEDAARDFRPYLYRVEPSMTLGRENFVEWALPLAEKQIQKASYQLAYALNTIFAK